jgi:hypothetical protein
MDDAQRYRMNAGECLSAAERCGAAYRDLPLAIAASWLSLARQQEAMDDSARSTASSGRPFQYPRDLHRLPFKMPARRWDAALRAREAISS